MHEHSQLLDALPKILASTFELNPPKKGKKDRKEMKARRLNSRAAPTSGSHLQLKPVPEISSFHWVAGNKGCTGRIQNWRPQPPPTTMEMALRALRSLLRSFVLLQKQDFPSSGPQGTEITTWKVFLSEELDKKSTELPNGPLQMLVGP